jgi:hypothetical protein
MNFCHEQIFAKARALILTSIASPSKVNMTDAAHYQHSSLRERIVEHVFVGDALRELWREGVTDVEVLRSEFDAFGYDLVMSRGGIVRHIQFKTGMQSKPRKVEVARALFEKPSGCVVWIKVSGDLTLEPFYWLGGTPGEPLTINNDFRAAKAKRRNKEGKRPDRPNHVDVPGAEFELVPTLRKVLGKLFGNLDGVAI